MSLLLIAFALSATQQLPLIAENESQGPIAAAQVQQSARDDSPTANPQEKSVLNVSPGEAAIKDKDLYEGTGYLHPFRRMPRFVLVDQKEIWTSPFRTSKEDAKWWAIWGGAVGGLIVADRYIQRAAPSNATLVRVGSDASYLGQWYTLLPVAAGFYVLGTAKGSDRLRDAGMLSFETIADVAIVQVVLKGALGRERPTEGNGNGAFEQSPNRINSSFPSGHTITTFAMGSILAHEYPRKWWIKALIYGYGSGVAAARLAANRHFPGDVVGGGVMGWFIGDYVYGKRHNRDLDEKPGITSTILSHIQFGAL